ncbi:hypothetical protein STCU_07487 [Strigomonas culicis]|uniref:Uncharacterized protein n=1 Tax=Strigomonas culicis TaxID=28005 RepID=S9U481_9TRYP|nr:hypothetical protein STCU_07487 [Strigomonas culicis]|eukprot:EPY23753.1 hypothetical protein STCU_07487 [Strigomonas culicis]
MEFDLLCSLALMSAASQLAEKDTYEAGTLRPLVQTYTQFLEDRVVQAREQVSGHFAKNGVTVPSVKEAIEQIQKEQQFERQDTLAEYFTLQGLLEEGKASEYVLNLFLCLVFSGGHAECTLVGVDLVFRWLRLSTAKKQNLIFATWSYGAFERKNMEKFIKSVDSQWFKKQETPLQNRKNIICALLKRQLSLLANGATSASKERQVSICKEQLLFLLAV